MKKSVFLVLTFLSAATLFCEEEPSNLADTLSKSKEVNLYNLPEKQNEVTEDKAAETEVKGETEAAGETEFTVETEVTAETEFTAETEETVETELADETEVTAESDGESSEETLSATEDDSVNTDGNVEAEKPEASKKTKAGLSEVPPAKRPKPIDKEKAEKAAEKDDSEEDVENYRNTIKYGIPSEISDLLDKLIENDDPRFTEEIYDVFQVTKNSSIKEKVLKYFTKLEDPCLEDFAVNLMNDPYDEKNDVVKAAFKYISAVKTEAAIPAILTLIESENETYFNDAIDTIGEIGGSEEAVYLVEYLDRDDLSDAQRQSLMRTSGKMHAVETWDKLVEILEDEDENAYVRMYAAEAIGLMEKNESVPVLVQAFNDTDPNVRQYVIKGLSHFPDVVEAKETILQGIRDEYWRVRQESVKTAADLKMEDSVPFLIYRIKNDSEKVIKEDSIKALAQLNTDEGNDYLISQLTDKKVGDGTKKKIVEVLLKEGNAGQKEILELADTCVTDDKRKDLRYAIGKELAKYENSAFEDICLKYLESKDTTTISLGIDIYKTNKFHSAEEKMRSLYAEKKTNSSIKNRIQKMLKIQDEEDKTETK